VSLIRAGMGYNISNHPFVRTADVFVIARGNECSGENGCVGGNGGNGGYFADNAANSKNVYHNFKKLLRDLHRHGINTIIHMTKRKKGVSATDFVKALIGYRQGTVKRDKLYKHLPSSLPHQICNSIINDLVKCKLRYKKHKLK